MTKLIVAFRSFAKAPINVQDISVDWRVILSVILKTLCRKAGAGLFWLRTGTSSSGPF